MSRWRKEPPTYKEWSEAKNHGCWWVKFCLSEQHQEEVNGRVITWPEAWYTDIVSITVSYEKGSLLDSSAARLHAKGTMLKFDLDDPEATKDLYWQPVIAPYNDVKDRRPDGC